MLGMGTGMGTKGENLWRYARCYLKPQKRIRGGLRQVCFPSRPLFNAPSNAFYEAVQLLEACIVDPGLIGMGVGVPAVASTLDITIPLLAGQSSARLHAYQAQVTTRLYTTVLCFNSIAFQHARKDE